MRTLASGEQRAPWLPASGSISRHPTHDKAQSPQAPQRAAGALTQRESWPLSGQLSSGSLDTLAQLDQNPVEAGTNLRRRARSMYFSKPLATALAETAKRVGSALQQSYRNTVYCNAQLQQDGGKVTGRYCGNRWCITCSRIRTALAMNRYLPVLSAWRDRQLVTLTLRNVPAAELDRTLDEMLAAFTAAKRAITRTDALEFKALRKLEVTYNIHRDDYHPHFHVTVEGERAAAQLVARWLAHFAERADAKAQDIRSAADDGTLRELFKYFTKLVTKSRMMPPAALDVIFRAMRGRRVYQPVGFTLPAELPDDEGELPTDAGTAAISRPAEQILWTWEQGASDWIDRESGECLTGYQPSEKFRQLVESISSAEPPPAMRLLPPDIPAEPIAELSG
jgi:hypothetical protein